MIFRNRAIDGDLVVIELLPQSQWGSRMAAINRGGTFPTKW